MSNEEFPKQPDFTILSESTGQTLLSDGSTAETRIVLADLVVVSEDPLMGPSVTIKPVVALRVKSPMEVQKLTKDSPLMEKVSVPFTPEAGFEQISIEKTIKPTVSMYLFDMYVLTITLEIIFVARNTRFKTDSNAPIYNFRWTINPKITKATASK